MGLLNKIKGFIKLSEVAADSANSLLDTAQNESAITVFSQTVNTLEDALRKQGVIVTSTGNITWTLNKLTLDVGVNIIIKLMQNPNGQVVNLVMNYADFATDIYFANDGDIFYIELNRNLISSGTIPIYNGGVNVGQRALVAPSLPALVNNQSGSFQGTICIPIAVRQGNNLWWSPSGFCWPPGKTEIIGGIGSTPPIPTGSVLSFSGSDINVPTGYLFCDGSPKSAVSYPALALLFWRPSLGTYIYGGSTAPIGTQTPPGNFNLPDLQGLFIKGAGSHSTLINGKQYSATLAQKDSDRTAVNSLSVTADGQHIHPYPTGPELVQGGLSGTRVAYWTKGSGTTYTGYDGNHNHGLLSGADLQTHPAHMALNYIIRI